MNKVIELRPKQRQKARDFITERIEDFECRIIMAQRENDRGSKYAAFLTVYVEGGALGEVRRGVHFPGDIPDLFSRGEAFRANYFARRRVYEKSKLKGVNLWLCEEDHQITLLEAPFLGAVFKGFRQYDSMEEIVPAGFWCFEDL